MIRLLLFCGTALLVTINSAVAQNKFPGVFNSKLAVYASFNGGYGVSLATAYWLTREDLLWSLDFQPGVNLAFTLAGTRYALGNKNRQGSRTQLNIVITPLNVLGIAGKSHFEEVPVFKIGHSSAFLANNEFQFVLGSNFVLTPKSNVNIFRAKFNTDNVYTTKNRSQQLIVLGARATLNWNQKNRLSFQALFYNDNMVIPYILQQFADHYDRYYTGGLRFSANLYTQRERMNNKPWHISYASDVYTGSFERDLFDYPDVYDINEQFDVNKPELTRNARYVNQEPGERMLNEGRKIINIGIPLRNTMSSQIDDYRNWGLNVFLGVQGGEQGIRPQNRNHSGKVIHKVNARRYNPAVLHSTKGKDKKELERFHWFNPTAESGRFIIGGGFNGQL